MSTSKPIWIALKAAEQPLDGPCCEDWPRSRLSFQLQRFFVESFMTVPGKSPSSRGSDVTTWWKPLWDGSVQMGGSKGLFFEGAEERKRNGHEGSVWENINESVHELLYCVISRRDYQLWRHATRILKVQFAYVVFSFQFIHGLDIFRSFLYLRRAGPSGDFRPVDWNMRGVGLCCLTDDTRCQAADWWPL